MRKELSPVMVGIIAVAMVAALGALFWQMFLRDTRLKAYDPNDPNLAASTKGPLMIGSPTPNARTLTKPVSGVSTD